MSIHSLPSLGVNLEKRFFWPGDAAQMIALPDLSCLHSYEVGVHFQAPLSRKTF